MAEKTLFEAKLGGTSPSDEKLKAIKKAVAEDINSQRAAADIAKSLVQDYILLITIACCKAVFQNMPHKKDVLDSLRSMWNERVSINLSTETKMFQDSLFHAMNMQKEVDEKTTEKMNEQIQKFCITRDESKKLADEAVNGIIQTILAEPKDDTPKQETEKKEER